MDGARSMYGGRDVVHTESSWENLTEGDPLVDLDKDGKIRLKWIFKTCDGETWTGLICPRIGTGGGCLRTQ